jgi:hypothetical protein
MKKGTATKSQQDMKGDQCATALDNGIRNGILSPETAAHIAKTAANTSPQYQENIASLDKRVFSDHCMKLAIDQARAASKTPEQKTGLKKDGTPSRRTTKGREAPVVVSSSEGDDALSAASTPQKKTNSGGSGSGSGSGGGGSSGGGGTRPNNLDGYNKFQKSPEIAGKGYTQAQKSELFQAHKAKAASPTASPAPAATVAAAPSTPQPAHAAVLAPAVPAVRVNLDRYNAFQKSPEIAGKGYTQAQKSELYQAHKAATAAPAASPAPAVTTAAAPARVAASAPAAPAPVSVPSHSSYSAPSYSGYSGGSGYSGSSGGSNGGSSGGHGGGGSSSGGGGGLGWNAFQSSVGGQGYSRAEISSMYHAQK